jgi:mannitol-1-phosphate 5-dehydrogenase
MREGNPLRICAEDYGILPVDKNAFKGRIPAIKGVEARGNFSFFVEQKLFIHNMGHASSAYLGMLHGDKFIHEAVSRPEILFIIRGAMTESASALSKKYSYSPEDLHTYIEDLIRRFSNRALKDTCARVGADPERKLGERDRFIGALRLCEEEGVKPEFISIGTAAALYRYIEEKNLPQNENTARRVLTELSALPAASAGFIITEYSR